MILHENQKFETYYCASNIRTVKENLHLKVFLQKKKKKEKEQMPYLRKLVFGYQQEPDAMILHNHKAMY